jgi:hypothetical protein
MLFPEDVTSFCKANLAQKDEAQKATSFSSFFFFFSFANMFTIKHYKTHSFT